MRTWEDVEAAFQRIDDRKNAEILIVSAAELERARLVDVIDRTSKLADPMGFLPCRVRAAGSTEQEPEAIHRPANGTTLDADRRSDSGHDSGI
jgi:hypothetical protein